MADSNTVHVGTHPGPTAVPYEIRLTRVEDDVKDLKDSLGEIKLSMTKGFEAIGQQLSSKSQTNWHALGLIAVVMIPALGWAWSQLGTVQQHADAAILDAKVTLSSAIAKQETALAGAIADQKATGAGYMRREDIVAMNAATEKDAEIARGYQEKIADLQTKLIDARVTRDETTIAEMQKQIVPLSTHQELWAKQADTNKAISAEIDENRRSLAEITAPRDTISRIYKRLDDIEMMARDRLSRPN